MAVIKDMLKKIFYALPSSQILMFHHVTDTPQVKCSSCMLQTERFYDIISNSKNICSLEYLIDNYKKDLTALTFDDGLEDLYTIAFPYLRYYAIPFTIFVVTDFINQPGYLTVDQIKELADCDLVTIGSHGVTHDVFTKMNIEQQERELKDSREKLETISGRPVELFAYSHGEFDKTTLRLIKKYYKYAFCVRGVKINMLTRMGRYALTRIEAK